MQASLLMVRFPFGRTDDPDVTDWWAETICRAKLDPRISAVQTLRINTTPITLGRNQAAEAAIELKADYLLMVDNDMAPDAYLPTNQYKLAADPNAKPFFQSSFDWLWNKRDEVAMVGAPYCGPPPYENVYVFRWATRQSDHPDPDLQVEFYGREEAAMLAGIQPAAALPTGIILIDTRAFKYLKQPYFYYEYKNTGLQCGGCGQYERGPESALASTEDVTFTRDALLNGVKTYCNWDAWAGHWKRKCVGKPKIITADNVRQTFKDAVQRGFTSTERNNYIDTERIPESKRDLDKMMAGDLPRFQGTHGNNLTWESLTGGVQVHHGEERNGNGQPAQVEDGGPASW